MKWSTGMSLISWVLVARLGFASEISTEKLPTLSVRIHEQANFTEAQRKKLDQAVAIFEKVTNSAEFKDRVLNFRTKTIVDGKPVWTEGFTQTDGLTNAQVLHAIYQGSENFHGEPDFNPPSGNGLADYFLSAYNGIRGIVGYTNKGRRRIHMNAWYFERYSARYIAGNLMHEWLHKLGFGHDTKPTPLRRYSVPYGVGDLVRELATDEATESVPSLVQGGAPVLLPDRPKDEREGKKAG